MAALKLDMTIPLGSAGHVRLTIDIADLDALDAAQRATLAGIGDEFYAFAAATLAPGRPAAAAPATVHDPDAGMLRGVTGSRIREKL